MRLDETCPLLVNAEHVVTEPGCPPIAGVGVTCRQRCDDGYIQAGGSASRTCTTQLTWSGTSPVCIAGQSLISGYRLVVCAERSRCFWSVCVYRA